MCMAACYVALALFPLNQMMLIQSAFTMVVVFSGLNTVGVVKAAQLVSDGGFTLAACECTVAVKTFLRTDTR